MIRIARNEDLDQILMIVNETIEDLQKQDNYQWSDTYPTRKHFEEDIKNVNLYVFELNNEVAGFICINKKEDSAYQSLSWTKESCAIVIHRFAVKRSYQRQKIATKLIEFVEHFAKNKNINYIKVDTNSKNSRMNTLFNHLGYTFIGEINLRDLKDVFNCYDKILT
ncbi:GNAT family N-acetyltransferase [Mycoplasmatota bacterium]|nr:GNAT family N-acetyltransferase [Mycoplasmatota bacterium]